MSIHVVQGERELVADCRSLARFELRGIPPMVAGAARIKVAFTVDADGLLAVTAREETAGVEATVTVKPSFGLSDEEVARMLGESFRTAEADMAARSLREAQVDADRLRRPPRRWRPTATCFPPRSGVRSTRWWRSWPPLARARTDSPSTTRSRPWARAPKPSPPSA
jgi:hypothetical protein